MNTCTQLVMSAVILSTAMICGERELLAESPFIAQSKTHDSVQRAPILRVEDALQLAARHEAEAEQYEAEARRAEQQALRLAPNTDRRGEQYQQLMAESRSYWRKALALRTQAVQRRAESTQHQSR